jgi:hypothetical protein
MITRSWKRAKCFGGLGCVEVRLSKGRVELRDSGDRKSVVRVDLPSWEAFIKAAESGSFNIKPTKKK